MAFMMGMYDVDRSGDTERISIRGSDQGAGAPRESRLMSAGGQRVSEASGGRRDAHSIGPW
jgi:hypothetical protein